MTIWAYGDSFVAGDQDEKDKNNADISVMEYNRYNVSFVSHLSNMLEIDLVNRAVSGSGNFPQIDKLLVDSKKFKDSDIVLFGITSTWRDRFSLPHHFPEILNKNIGPFLIDMDLYKSKNFNTIPSIDLFHIISILDSIEIKLNVKILKFNCFHDVYIETEEYYKKFFSPNNYIGFGKKGNTLTDILLDSWDEESNSNLDHTTLKIAKNYKRFFTCKNHPNTLGHQKIADWFYNYFKNNKII
jgi:hypothetical protein